MSPLTALIDEVHAAGAELVVIGGTLKLVGDRTRVSAELRARLHAARDGLLDYMRPHPCASCGLMWFREVGTVCYWCQRRAAQR